MPARSGAEYLAGLRDGREIWLGGERVASVPEDPILGRMARSLAELYDLQWDPAYQPRLCAHPPFLDPQSNRARTQAGQPDPPAPLPVVGESADGLVVSGARTLATLAPFADELLVLPSTTRLQPQDAARYAFAFAVP